MENENGPGGRMNMFLHAAFSMIYISKGKAFSTFFGESISEFQEIENHCQMSHHTRPIQP